jgi:hypothetical protein
MWKAVVNKRIANGSQTLPASSSASLTVETLTPDGVALAPFLRALVLFERFQVYSVVWSRHGYLISHPPKMMEATRRLEKISALTLGHRQTEIASVSRLAKSDKCRKVRQLPLIPATL